MQLDLSDSITGLKQSVKAVKSGAAAKAYVAADADAHVREPFIDLCRDYKVPVVFCETGAHLGSACGIEVGAAVAVVKKG